MKNLLLAIIFICPPFFKKWILRWCCRARFGRDSYVGWFSAVVGREVEFGSYSCVKPFTLILLDGKIKLGDYTEVSSFSIIYGCSDFVAGHKCYIGPQVWINCSEDVVIGNNVGIGPRSMIFTHGSFLPYTEGYPVRFGRVRVGNRVWIPAGVFIYPGVEIGDNVIVNSRSVIKRSIEAGQYVEGFPAKAIRPVEEICITVTEEKRDELIRNMMRHFVTFVRKARPRIEVIQESGQSLELRYRGKDYLVTLMGTSAAPGPGIVGHVDKKLIILLNSQQPLPLHPAGECTVFDFRSLKTCRSNDDIHRELYLFFKMYYGIIFEYEGISDTGVSHGSSPSRMHRDEG